MNITTTEKHLTKLMPYLSRTTLNVLNYTYCDKGDLHVTDLDAFLVLKNTGTPEGKTLNNTMFKKTKSISQSIDENGPDFDEYPIYKWTIENKTEIKSTDFLIQASDVKQFVSTDDTSRVSLTGVNVSFKENEVCGTDGHRAGINKFEYSDLSNSNLDFILPIQAITHLNYIIENFDVKIYVDGKDIIAMGDDIQYSHKLIEGPYPQYQKVIPSNFKTEIANKQRSSI